MQMSWLMLIIIVTTDIVCTYILQINTNVSFKLSNILEEI
jgi:hypothetical protein